MLSLLFEDNGTGHRDLVLTLGEAQWRADSYYLALDRGLLPDHEDVPKIRLVLRRLLQQWAHLVTTLEDGKTVYLAYDFSDQYTAWIECSREQHVFALRRGWSTLEGWALYPSDLGQHVSGPRAFQPDATAPVRMPREDLLRMIEASVRGAE